MEERTVATRHEQLALVACAGSALRWIVGTEGVKRSSTRLDVTAGSSTADCTEETQRGCTRIVTRNC